VLSIYDASGRLVRTLVDASLSAGRHTAGWNGLDQNGRRAPAGEYLYRLSLNGEVFGTRKLITF